MSLGAKLLLSSSCMNRGLMVVVPLASRTRVHAGKLHILTSCGHSLHLAAVRPSLRADQEPEGGLHADAAHRLILEIIALTSSFRCLSLSCG